MKYDREFNELNALITALCSELVSCNYGKSSEIASQLYKDLNAFWKKQSEDSGEII